MDDKIIFKTATVGGFEKKAVTDYIFQMNEDNDYAQQQLHNKVSELEEVVLTLENEKAEANQRIDLLQEELTHSAQRVSNKDQKQEKLSSLSDELSDKIEKLEQTLEEKEREAVAQKSRNKELEDRYSDLEGKREEIDRTTTQLGRVMLDARADSDSILENSKKEAELVMVATQKKADVLLKEAQEKSDTLENTLKSQADGIIKDAQQEANEILEDARDFSEATLFAAEEQSKVIIQDTQNRVATMVSISQNTTEATNEHLLSLRKQSSAIQETITEAFRHILEQSTVLEQTISNAETTIGDVGGLSETAGLFEVPDLSADDIRAIKERMKENRKNFKLAIDSESANPATPENAAEVDKAAPTEPADPAGGDVPPAPACDEDGCAVPRFVHEENIAPVLDFALEEDSSFELSDEVTLPALSDMSSEHFIVEEMEDSFFFHADSDK